MNWKGELAHAVTFVLLPCLGALAAWFAFRTDRFDRLDGKRWFRIAAALFLITRVGTHLLVFPLFGYAGGNDLLRVWEPIARAVLEGRDPTPWIDNLYGPLFPVVLGLGYALSGGRHAPGIDAPFVVADAISLWLLLRIARRRFPEPLARRLVLALLVSPLLWHNTVVRTQDEALFAMFLLLALDLLERGKEIPGAVAAALGTLCTKALFPLWVFPVLLSAGGGWKRTTVRVALAGGLTVLGMGLYPLFDWDVLGKLRPAIDVRGSSAWLLVPDAATRLAPHFRVGLAVTAAACIAAAFLATRRAGTVSDRAASGVVSSQAAFFFLCPFTLPPHLVQGFPFLLWQAAEEGAADARPASRGGLLLLLFAAWQVPSVWLNSEFWKGAPWLIAAFVATWAWTGYLALRAKGDGTMPPRAGGPA